jgi:predicted CXXCH cytochrome family protein
MLVDMDDKGTHPLFRDRACLTCHDPHAENNIGFTKKPVKEMCLDCHTSIKKTLDDIGFKHSPVAEGECTACHNPHGSKLEYQLLSQPNDLCLSCHERIITTKDRKGHIAMENGSCLSCHTSHYSELKGLMVGKDPAICKQCHSDDTERLISVHRQPLDKISACMSCHEHHVAEKPGMLKLISHDPFTHGNCEACHVE